MEVDCDNALPYDLNGHHGDVYSTGEIDTEWVLKHIKESDFKVKLLYFSYQM